MSNADQHSRYERRIMNRDQFRYEVGPASHIAQKRDYTLLSYYHHFLVEEVQDTGVDIIHYGPVKYSGKVHETFLKFDDMDFELGVYLISSNGYPQFMEEKDEAIRRARSRLGEDKYMATINNCEHFVTWALTGTPLSLQIKDATRAEMLVADTIDAVCNKKTKISAIGSSGASTIVVEEVGKTSVETAETKGIQALGENAVEAVGKATVEAAETKGIQALGENAVEAVGKATVEAAETKGIQALGENAFEAVGKAAVETAETKGIQALGENAVEAVGKATVEAVETKGIQALGENAVEAIGAATAAGKAVGEEVLEKVAKSTILRPSSTTSVLKSAGKVAAVTTVIEAAVLAWDIYDLNKSHAAGKISEGDLKRGIFTRTSGAIGSVAGGTAGTIIGQLLIPVPVVGGLLGGFIGSVLTSTASSAVSGLLFDSA